MSPRQPLTDEELRALRKKDWHAWVRHEQAALTETEPSDLDYECRQLCLALNQLPGIVTTGSCCGHGREPYRIFFCVDPSLPHLDRSLAILTKSLYCGRDRWQVRLCDSILCYPPYSSFILEGPPNADGDALAEKLLTYLYRPEANGWREGFDMAFGPLPVRWGIWYAGTMYGGPRWCHMGRAVTEIKDKGKYGVIPSLPLRLEYESKEAAERALPYVSVGSNDYRTLYSVRPLSPSVDWFERGLP